MITPGMMKAIRFHGTSSPPRETIPPIWVPAATADAIKDTKKVAAWKTVDVLNDDWRVEPFRTVTTYLGTEYVE